MKNFSTSALGIGLFLLSGFAMAQKPHSFPEREIRLPRPGTSVNEHQPVVPIGQKVAGIGSRLLAIHRAMGNSQSGQYEHLDSGFYTYPNLLSNNPGTETRYRWDGSVYNPEAKYTYTYNSAGNIATALEQEWTGSNWTNRSNTVYSYNPAGDLNAALNQEWIGASWNNYFLDSLFYNSSGRPVVYLSKIWNNVTTQWYNSFRSVYTYDASGNNILWEAEYWVMGNSIWEPFARQRSHFNASNYLVNWTGQSYDGSTWENEDSTSNTSLNAAGQPLSAKRFNWTASVWYNYQDETYTYTSANLESSFKYTYASNSGYMRGFKTYNSYNQLMRSYSEQSPDNINWTPGDYDNNDTYYYQSYTTTGLPVASGQARVQVYPNPVTDFVYISFDAAAATSTIASVYSATGQLVKRSGIPAAQKASLDLRDLPPGAYTLELRYDSQKTCVALLRR